jgi:hypothetical protein
MDMQLGATLDGLIDAVRDRKPDVLGHLCHVRSA